jgi:N-acetylmuramoyl-L-alanine amidase
MKVALCIGHSRTVGGRIEGGAISALGESEHAYWSVVAPLIAERLSLPSIIVSRYGGSGYGAAMKWVAAHLRAERVGVAIELHFNSSGSPASRGHEWLYWHRSPRGAALARSLSSFYDAAFPGRIERGAKPIQAGGRGAGFLRGTHCPAVVAEPFFGSHLAEAAADAVIAADRGVGDRAGHRAKTADAATS